MKYILSGILCLPFSLLLAQQLEFAPLNAQWYYREYCQQSPLFSPCGYHEVLAHRDTLIQGDSCRVVEIRDDGSWLPNSQVILKTEGEQVFFWENQQFKLLYDFGLGAGDTLSFQIPHHMPAYDLACGEVPDTAAIYRVRIDSVALVDIDGSLLKRQYTSLLESPAWAMGQITEKLGSEWGLFGLSGVQCLSGFPGYFRCYQDANISYQASAEACDATTPLENTQPRFSFRIYPQPAHDWLQLTVDATYPWSLVIYDARGRSVLARENVRQNKLSLPVGSLSPGVYLLRVEVEGQGGSTEKIVIQ
jgi:hypothetical protein